jgi:hypothetical protein
VRPLEYHDGQRAIQDEAKTRHVADKLADWVGPAREFTAGADLLVFSTQGSDGVLHLHTLCGTPPLVETPAEDVVLLRGFTPAAEPTLCGGLAIHLGQARRARINGVLSPVEGGSKLELRELFTLCRKYMAPSIAPEGPLHVGPAAREPIGIGDAWVQRVVERAETSFLASIAPSGLPDVAHRGGPPGFLSLDTERCVLSWPEYVGDGIFKSAGNVRATRKMTMLVVDLETGDAVELHGSGEYENLRSQRKQRSDALVKHRDPYPVQGQMRCRLEGAMRLREALLGRQRIERAARITSKSDVAQQKPQ